jgi:DNA-directed RNA polymerase subunit RPC12/RpoP
MTLRVFKCPFCGYRFKADPEGRYETGKTDIVRGPVGGRGGAEGPRRVDLTCLNCGQEFEVEVQVEGRRLR